MLFSKAPVLEGALDAGRVCKAIRHCAHPFSFLSHGGCFLFMVLTIAASMVVATIYNWLTRGIAIRLAAVSIGRQCCSAERWLTCSGDISKAERASLVAGWRYHQIALGLVAVFLIGALSDAITNAGAQPTGALNAIFGALMLGPIKELGTCSIGWAAAACGRKREGRARVEASSRAHSAPRSELSSTSAYT